jgi:acylphosphatase
MKEDNSAEKKFLEYLDRLLAGEEITPGDDVSNDMRSALEHARKMLEFREEPSEAFRAELRDKLLRQVAEKQAPRPAAEPQSAWERMGSMFTALPALIAVAGSAVVVLLIFVGIVWFSGHHAGAPVTTMSPAAIPPAGEYSVRLPANIVPPDVTFIAKTPLSNDDGEAAIYQVENSEVTVDSVKALGERLGFTGEANLSEDGTRIVMYEGEEENMRQLSVWTASGAVEYGYVSPEKLFPSQPVELPPKSQAEIVAYNFLQQADLLPAEYEDLAEITNETTVAAGGGYSVNRQYAAAAPPATAAAPTAPSAPSEQAMPSTAPSQPAPTYWQVDFPYLVDSSEATGPGSKLEVDIGDKGKVVSMNWSWRQMSPLTTDMIISEEQAFQNLVSGKGSLEVPLGCHQVIVNHVQLKYWLDATSEKQDYTVPVYEFTGTCLDKNGRTLEDFTGWAPALPAN